MEKLNAASANEPSPAPALIVFGQDDSGKPHASWFSVGDAELAERAAGLMNMRALRVASDDHRAIAAQLPQGRIFDSGKGFVPFCKGAVYKHLCAFPEAFEPPPPVIEEIQPVPSTGTPARWDDIEVGSLVLACEEGGSRGWYESVVVEAKPEALFVLRWRDWPDEPAFVRRSEHLALLREL